MPDILPPTKDNWVEPSVEALNTSDSEGQLELGNDASVFGNEHFS
jgi:hypothetical protein